MNRNKIWGLFVLTLVVLSVVFFFYLRDPIPPYEGEYRVSGLSQTVEVFLTITLFLMYLLQMRWMPFLQQDISWLGKDYSK